MSAAGKLSEALQTGIVACERARMAFEFTSQPFRASVNVVAATCFEQQNYVTARALLEWLSRTASEAGDDKRTAAITDANLAHCLMREGHYDQAIPALNGAFDRLVEEDAAAALQSMHGVAWSAFELGLYDLSAQIHLDVLNARLRVLTPNDPELATSYFNAGTALRKAGKLEESAGMLAEAVRRWRAALGDDHPRVISALLEYAKAVHQLARFEEAAVLYRRSIELVLGTSAEEAALVSEIQSMLSACQSHLPPAADPPHTPALPANPFGALVRAFDQSSARSFGDCIRSFMARNYAACVESGLDFTQTTRRHDVMQLLLIALQRIRLDALAEKVAGWCLEVSAGTPYQALLAFTAGRTDFPTAETTAARAGISREFEFYAGSRLSTAGELDSAADLFERLSREERPSTEWLLALPERLLRGVKVDTPATPTAEQVHACESGVEQILAATAMSKVIAKIEELADAGDIEGALARARIVAASLAKDREAHNEEVAIVLNLAGHILFSRRRYRDSLPYYEQSLDALRACSPPSVQLPAALNNLGNVYMELGMFQEAVQVQLDALAQRQAANGDIHPLVLLSLLDLGLAHQRAGDLQNAQERYREALEVACAGVPELGPYVQRLRHSIIHALKAGHLDSARSTLAEALRVWETATQARTAAADLRQYAGLLREVGKLDRAEANLQHALDELRKDTSADAAMTAAVVFDLGLVHEQRDDKGSAARHFRQALELSTQARQMPLSARILLALARVEAADAEQHVRRALRAAEDANEPAIQAAACHELGSLKRQARRFEEALNSFSQALALRAPDDAFSRMLDLTDLAEVAANNLQLSKAESWLADAENLLEADLPIPKFARAVCRKLRGRIALFRLDYDEALVALRVAMQHASTDVPSDTALRGSIQADLGEALLGRGEVTTARAVLKDACELLTRSADDHRVGLGVAYNRLAVCELSLGQLAAASESIRKAHDLLTPVLEPDHIRLGSMWYTSGAINTSIGAHKTAETQLQRARHILVNKGDADALSNVDLQSAVLQYAENRWEDCLASASRVAADSATGSAVHTHACMWQARALAALDRRESALQTMLSVSDWVTSDFARVAAKIATAERARHSARITRILDEILSLAVDPALEQFTPRVFTAVQRSKALIAETFVRQRKLTKGRDDLRKRWDEISQLQTLIGRLLLARPDEPLTPDERRRVLDWEARIAEIERDLVHNEGRVEQPSAFIEADAAAILDRLSPDEMLLDYVYFRRPAIRRSFPFEDDENGHYCAFALFTPASQKPSVRLFDLGTAADLESCVQAFRDAITERRDSVRDLGADLRGRLLDPVLSTMGEPLSLIVAADAALNTIPFDALVWADQRWLLDVMPVSMVDVARDVLQFGQDRKSGPSVVMAAPDFDLSEAPGTGVQAIQSRVFPELSGAEEEGRLVAARLGVEPLMGAGAVESVLRRVRCPTVLHLATHGFFIPKKRYVGRPDVFASISMVDIPGEGKFVVGATRPASEDDPDALIHGSRLLANPLLRSGMVMAGANTWLAGDTLPIAAEDGVVTSLDVAGLDLQGTQLVVLSACETGLGVAEAREGILGLRRAFRQAGANTVVASLWKVADKPTALLMDEFYRRLVAGESRVAALQRSKADLRARGYTDPVFWAAFVCSGDPSQLSGLPNA